MEEFLQVGVITATHGIHGEVKVFPTTDDPKRFKKLKKCFWIPEEKKWNWKWKVSSFSKIWSS